MTQPLRTPVSLALVPGVLLGCLAGLMAGLIAGCDASPEPRGSAVRTVVCPVWECGTNAAELNELPIGELHLVPGQNTGETSAWSARIIDFVAPPGTPGGPLGYTLRVQDGRFSAARASVTLKGSELIGSKITIENTGDGTTVELIIHDHGTVPSWTGNPFPVDRYVLTSYDETQQRHVPVCTDASDTSHDSAWAVLVSGERYSWSAKSVIASGPTGAGWFNISCKDNALYKMKLMGYDPQPGPANTHSTTPEQRQATLKMVTADYCGTGYSFTETGTPLHWYNQAGWSDNGMPPSSTFEALWNHTGALCLDTPRLGTDELQDILDECASANKQLPLCSDFTGAYEWGTENPQ